MATPSRRPEAKVALKEVSVDDVGVRFRADRVEDRVLDVLLDGRRVWSFWLLRDTSSVGKDRLAEWPQALTRFLDGTTRLSIVDHVADEELFAGDVELGAGEGRIEVVDGRGRPLALDKSLRLSRVFGSRTGEQVAPLLDSIEAVLEALDECGVEGFLCYGTLLGAVRNGKLIGHDSDADIGYVSRCTHPTDAVRESFEVQRRLVALGLVVVRYSGFAFRVDVREADGTRRGLDVFGGFLRDGWLYLMGEVGAPFREEWIWPLGSVSLEGRRLPAPREPDRLLEAMYGPRWRVPDPAFQFDTPPEVQRRLTGWFRGTRVGRDLTWNVGSAPGRVRGEVRPSAFARWVLEREPEAATFIDVGCGAGADVHWLAQEGRRAVGLDFLVHHYRAMARRCRREDLPATFRWLNLCEHRSVLATATELSRMPGPRVLMARHVADATDRTGRESLMRLGRLLCRSGGRLYLQVQERTPDAVEGSGLVEPLPAEILEEAMRARGGRLVERVEVVEDEPPMPGSTVGEPERGVTRWVISWAR